jgi:DNA repair protein SbcC/Rad50
VENAHVLEEEAALELKERTKELDHLHGLLEERRTAWVRDRQDAETKRDELRRQYGELKIQREQLVELGEEGICPTCTRPLGQNFRTVLEDVEAKLGMVAVDGRYYANRLDQLEKMPDDLRELEDKRRALVQSQSALERRLAKCQAAVQEKAQVAAEIDARETRRVKLSADLQSIASGYDASRHRELRSEVERLSGLRARVEVLGSRVEREPQLRDEHARVMGLLEQLKERLSELRRAVSEIATDEAAFTKLRQEFEQLSDSARVAELAAVASAGEEETTRQAAETARRVAVEQEKMRQKLAELQGRRLLHDEVDRAYTDLRTELNFQLRPELSETASGFLSELTDGRYGEMELDDQYNIIVLEDGTPKPVISGGEEDLANLVLRLAISQMIADRAGQRFSLLILDEVFGSLDEIRRGTVMELLRRLQDRFEQVVLITHIETVRDGLDRVISVRYDAASGSSHVENGGLMATPEILDDSKLRGTGEAAD